MKILKIIEAAKTNAVWVIFVMIVTAFSPWVINGMTGSTQERWTFPMTHQRIEWVRGQVEKVPCVMEILAYQALLNEVIGWNLRIVHEQEFNRHWYSDWYSTDAWNTVKLIPLPDCKTKIAA